MLRLTKLTDYATALLTHIVRTPGDPTRLTVTARELAAQSHLPLPTVGKILRSLARAELLVSIRGVTGGYRLARRAEQISVADIIAAIEGPIALTNCARTAPEFCNTEPWCPVKQNWQTISAAVRSALEQLSLADLAQAPPQGLGATVQACTSSTRTGSRLLRGVQDSRDA